MTLDDIWGEYETYTKGASDSARQVAFAGIAVVWLFKVDSGSGIHLDHPLLVAGACFVIALAADLAQYLTGTIVFLALGTVREQKKGAARNADYPELILRPMDVLFLTKMLAVIVGYTSLLAYFFHKLS